jgi:uncharacterized protein YbjT (DUF2867 family)
MHIILGGTGHVGSAVAEQLIQDGEQVIVVSRHPEKAAALTEKGAKIANVDVLDTSALHELFLTGDRLFFLNPPAAPSTDTVAEEKKTLHSILKAIENSGIKKVVAESTYGAQPGSGHGDLNVLYEMEQSLKKMDLSVTIIHAAYYMSNWDGNLEGVQKDGKLYSFFPPDFVLPMVAPNDIGKFAAELMKKPIADNGSYYFEGPRAYTPSDVAYAFSIALNKSVEAVEIPQLKWKETFKTLGFSDSATESYAAMTRLTLEGPERPTNPVRGSTTIEQYVKKIVQRHPV